MDSGFLGQLIAGLCYLIVGAGLFRLSLVTGEKPERHLGFYFLLSGIDYCAYSIPWVFDWWTYFIPLAFLGRVMYAIAVVHLVVFIRSVFRPGETWATLVATFCSLGLFVGIAATAAQGAWDGADVDDPWFWPYFAGYTLALIWLTLEAFRCHTGARKRQRIGLCDRTVVNRYVLWGCFGIFQVLACFSEIILELDFMGDRTVSGWADALLSGTEIASIISLWLAFFPPPVYLKWIADRETREVEG